MRWITGLLIYTVLSTSALASAPDWQDETKWESWPTVGKSSLSWLFFKLFNSELKTPTGEYEESLDVTPHPMALSIEYQRDITKQQLMEATQDQWNYLGYSEESQKEWLTQLDKIYPSVQKGQRLVYITDGKTGEIHFYRDKSEPVKLGEIQSESLNDAFLSIWLSPGTEYPKHRAKLIGNRK
ncbi:hypothetical protein P7F88_17035 [Vibrio hannami]|uniref:hypothetical protein n=1 Tax=Vibrio hannami TaxID=2717094 RepID=UPI00240EB86D|nr:hypothetical protein [Vibrio hannami]MDG3087674.1 hypothetical protein [Vibrio hannami]